MEHTIEQMAALYADLANAQAEYAPLAKNREVEIPIRDKTTKVKVGSYKFRYADLEAVFSATRPALAKHGICFIQTIQSMDVARSAIVTVLAHKNGGTLTSTVEFNTQHADIKDFGARLTYLRRYAATAILGVAADDDLDQGDEETPNGSEKAAEQSRNEPSTNPDEKPAYPDEKLKKMLPKWQELVSSGRKTAEQVINTVTSGNTLSEAQIAAIRALTPTKGENA